MQYTLRSARKALGESSNAYGQNDLRESINRAVQHLSTMAGWERLRRVLRFSAVGPHFVLPQGCAGIVRACMNGRPATVRTQDFRFIQSGPGEMDRPPSGFCPVRASNIVDVGMKPVMFEPKGTAFKVFATVATPEGVAQDAKMVVRGVAPSGELESVVIDASHRVFPSSADPGGVEVPEDDPQLQVVTEVSLYGFDQYVTLYVERMDNGSRYPVALYNPAIEAPEFRHYEISGVPRGAPVELLVECRIEPVPLVEETDVLQIPSINPVEWMIRGDWMMKAGEVDSAQKYYSMAANWLKAQEVTETTVQTPVVVNSRMLGSPGEVSMESFNI